MFGSIPKSFQWWNLKHSYKRMVNKARGFLPEACQSEKTPQAWVIFSIFGCVQNSSFICFTLLFCEWIEWEKIFLNFVIISFFKWVISMFEIRKKRIYWNFNSKRKSLEMFMQWMGERKVSRKKQPKNENLWDTQNCLRVSKRPKSTNYRVQFQFNRCLSI